MPRRGLSGSACGGREPTSERGARPNQFYPIFVDNRTNTIHSIGGAVADDVDRLSVASPEGTRAVWPMKPDGTGDAVGVDARGVAPELEERVRACQQEGDCPVSPNGNNSGDSGRDHRCHRAGQGRFRSRYQTGRRRDDWHRWKSPVAFSLTATTGAGKTVMAAAVIEALFDGNPDYDFNSDRGAVVLWFTDDPSLNEQTRFRLLDAADRIAHSRLVVIENTFNQEKLEPGKVYFLNAQKLGKKSLLVRGAPGSSQERDQHDLPMPDARAFTMWDTLANTIADEHLTLYLIPRRSPPGHEAVEQGRSGREGHHRAAARQRRQRRPAGAYRVGDIRHGRALQQRDGEGRKPDQLPSRGGRTRRGCRNRVCSRTTSGSTSPPRPGQFDTVLLARATRKVKRATELWRTYVPAGRAQPPKRLCRSWSCRCQTSRRTNSCCR